MIQALDRGHRDLGRTLEMRSPAVRCAGSVVSGERRRRRASGILAPRLCPDPASDIPLAPRDAASPASTASRPADRDDREPPLSVRRDREDYSRTRKEVNAKAVLAR